MKNSRLKMDAILPLPVGHSLADGNQIVTKAMILIPDKQSGLKLMLT